MFKVERRFGPGLWESADQACLGWGPRQATRTHAPQIPLALRFETVHLDDRGDVVVARAMTLVRKSTEPILPPHATRALTYLRLSGCKPGPLPNFSTVSQRDGLRRFMP